jgi:hypothetical protein
MANFLSMSTNYLKGKKEKVALVIGNGGYNDNSYLENPTKDATAICDELQSLGFSIFLGIDLNWSQFLDIIEQFERYISSSESVQVSLIYYSGHALQVGDVNYLIPLNSDEDKSSNFGRYISLQKLIEDTSHLADKRLIFLDACRVYPKANKAIEGLAKTRGFEIDGERVEAPAGLSEIKTRKDTFIAFSAAPGCVAYDGAGELSPFTAALKENLASIDLPLSNIMNRVRSSVIQNTSNRQQPWDSNSLLGPYIFNPSSLFLLIGNAIGLIAFVYVISMHSFILLSSTNKIVLVSSFFILCCTTIFFLGGINSSYSRLRGAGPARPDSKTKRILSASLNGAIGGFYSGTIAGVVVSAVYYLSWLRTFRTDEDFVKWAVELSRWFDGFHEGNIREKICELDAVTLSHSVDERLDTETSMWLIDLFCPPSFAYINMEITLTCIGVATILGASTTAFTYGHTLRHKYSKLHILLRSSAAGLLTGMVTGPVAGGYFFKLNRPYFAPELLVPSALVVVCLIAFCIVNFGFEKFTAKRLYLSIKSSILAMIVSIALSLVLSALIFASTYYIQSDSIYFNIHFYGLVFGPILGFLIGLTKIWTSGMDY